MNDSSESDTSDIGWKGAAALAVLFGISVMTGSLLAGLVVSALLYVTLRWPWIIVILIGISALGD